MSGPGPHDLGPGGSGPGGPPAACAAVDDDLAELALGTLTGKAREAALAHLDACPRCSAEVDEMSASADQLVYLAPDTEPPVGFEARVFERLGLLRPASPPRSWPFRFPRRVLAIAAAVLLVVAFGVGAVVGRSTKPTGAVASPPIELSSLVSAGKTMGQVYVYAGNPTWLFMVIDSSDWQGTLRCEVVQDDGSPLMLGRFWLSDGKGAWAESVNVPAGRLVEARVMSAQGKVLAVANLS